MNRPTNTLWPEPTTERPDDEQIARWVIDADEPEATDGCHVEPDGVCPHGHPSWLIQLGII